MLLYTKFCVRLCTQVTNLLSRSAFSENTRLLCVGSLIYAQNHLLSYVFCKMRHKCANVVQVFKTRHCQLLGNISRLQFKLLKMKLV